MFKRTLVASVLSTVACVGFVINASAAEMSSSQLPTVIVEGVRDTLSDAYAGGQVARGARMGVLGNMDFMDTPFTVNSYTADSIKNTMSQTVGEAAKADPTIRFQYPTGSMIENYRIRNYTYNSNNMSLNGLMGMAPRCTAAAEMVERVEIQRGPNAFANGMNPGGEVAGNINLVSKHASYDGNRDMTIDYTAKSKIGGHIDIGERFGNEKEWGVRFNGVYRDGEGNVKDQDQKRELLALGVDYTKGKTRTTFDAFYQKDEFDGAGPTVIQIAKKLPKVPGSDINVKGLEGSMTNKGILLHTDYSFDKNISAYAGFGKSWSYYSGNIGGANMLAVDGNTGLGRLYFTNDKVWVDKMAWEAGVRAKFSTGSVNHEAVIATNVLNVDTGNNDAKYAMLPNISIYNMNYDLSKRPSLNPHTYKLQSVDLSSVVIADTMKFADDKVQFTAGVRNQKVHQRVFNSAGATTTDYDKTKATPMFSLLVKPWGEKVSLYASYSEALKAGNIVPNSPIYTNKNAVFAPYVSKQSEVGVKFDGKNIANTFSLYQIRQVNTFQQINSDGTRTFHADGEQRNRGIEWMTFGKVNDRVRLVGGLNFNEAKVTAGAANVGNLAWGSPKWMGTFGAEWDTPFAKGLTLSGRVIYTGKQFADSKNLMEMPSTTTFDLGARYTVKMGGKDVTFRALVENLFDKEYWGGNRSDSVLFVGSGRTFKLSATFSF